MNVKAIFKEVYGNNPNFITPEITRYVKITEDILGELSQGSGMFGSNTIYAITYLIYENNQWVKQHETERELENVFRSEEEREEYIRQIRSVF